MYQNLYKSKRVGRIASLAVAALVLSACHSCQPVRQQYQPNGLIVGAVINAPGRDALKPYQRWRYADRLASHILSVNPELSGSIDSYEYLNARVGKPLDALLNEYRATGSFSDTALDKLKQSQLRRRYLMMVSIHPNQHTFPLKPDLEPVTGRLNQEVQDYYDQNRHTILLTAVQVRVYDTVAGKEIFESVVRSDDGDHMVATESRSTKYVGNSLLALITNSVSNGLNGSADGEYPAPPDRDEVLEHMWSHIAEELPAEVF